MNPLVSSKGASEGQVASKYGASRGASGVQDKEKYLEEKDSEEKDIKEAASLRDGVGAWLSLEGLGQANCETVEEGYTFRDRFLTTAEMNKVCSDNPGEMAAITQAARRSQRITARDGSISIKETAR
jgi:hypothetical protein